MKVVSTAEFWFAMCRYEFIRTGTHQGWIRNELIVTFAPPDREFVLKQMDKTRKLLRLDVSGFNL